MKLIDRIRACSVGAAAGSVVVALEVGLWILVPGLLAGGHSQADWFYGGLTVLMFISYALIVAFVFFFVGQILVGLPVWLLLERVGRRGALDAAAAGALLAGLVAASLMGGGLIETALAAFVQIGIAGAVAGLATRWAGLRSKP